MSAVAVVPAAGASSRFGSKKLLAPVAGEPLLQHTLRSLFEAGIDRIVVVVTPTDRFERVSLMSDPRVTVVVNPDPARGMFSSIQVGLRAAEGDPVMVLPADMPFVSPAVIATVRDRCVARDVPIVPAFGDRRGHPLALPARLRANLLAADPASTLKDALLAAAGRAPGVEPVDDRGVVRDVDVPGDLQGI